MNKKGYCMRHNNLLNLNYLEKCVASHMQQQHDEQESSCMIKKAITLQVLERLISILLRSCINITNTFVNFHYKHF